MKEIKYFILFFASLMLILFFSCAGCQLVYLLRLSDSKLVTVPDRNIEQTAEYLYYNPLPLPPEITSLRGDINSQIHYLCANGDFAKNDGAYKGISWVINGTRIPDWMYITGVYIMLGTNASYHSCLDDDFYRWLPSGFHLIEIRSQSNPFDPGMSYQFGVKINDVLATPIPTLIPQTGLPPI